MIIELRIRQHDGRGIETCPFLAVANRPVKNTRHFSTGQQVQEEVNITIIRHCAVHEHNIWMF